MVTVEIKNQQTKIPLNPAKIIRIVTKILSRERVKSADLSFVFVTDQKIRELNKRYLHRAYATDVLAFDLRVPVRPAEAGRKRPPSLEGEIVISTGAACRQARQFGSSPASEVVLYIVHGVLHLLGYDDHKVSDLKKMVRQQNVLMKFLGPLKERDLR